MTTQIGGERFCVFRTSRSKSRLNFLSLLRGGCEDYVVNEAALDYLRRQPVEAAVIARLTTLQGHVFRSQMEWLAASGAVLDQHLRPAPAADAERSRHLGGAPASRADGEHRRGLRRCRPVPGCHACPVLGSCRAAPAEADAGLAQAGPGGGIGPQDDLVLLPQSEAVEAEPLTGRGGVFRRQFNRIFGQRTGYKELDELLARLARRKNELLRVLERPEIPLHTNASENDLRAWVIKRKISGGTMSADGRVARDVMLGLSKTCRKLGLSFFTYLGDRLGLNTDQPRIPPLADLVIQAA